VVIEHCCRGGAFDVDEDVEAAHRAGRRRMQCLIDGELERDGGFAAATDPTSSNPAVLADRAMPRTVVRE
ncbi:MAG TPA: hypothetical protein VFI46_01060, partial [Jiangellaceae bacterium]|nr:hypothetical protein [Jiangellaceae bacterium]